MEILASLGTIAIGVGLYFLIVKGVQAIKQGDNQENDK